MTPPVLVELAWSPASMLGPAFAALDVLRALRTLATMRAPRAAAPLHWRWFDARARLRPAGLPAVCRDPTPVPAAHAARVADVIVLPGWLARDVPHFERLVQESSPYAARIRRVHDAGGHVVAIGTGIGLAALAGLLRDREAVIPWAYAGGVLRLADGVRPRADRAWASDDRVWTCAAPALATELVLAAVADTAVAELALAMRPVLLHAPDRQQVAQRIVQDALSRRTPAGAVERARRWLDEHPTERYDLRRLAEVAATSPRTLLRHFATAQGTTPWRYLMGLRAARARVLLETTYLPIEQVARACGFEDGGTFRRVFRAETGELPASYRERHRLRTPHRRWQGYPGG